MNDRLLHGEPVSDEQIQAWADEAERGYDLTKLASPLSGVKPALSGVVPRRAAMSSLSSSDARSRTHEA